MERYACPSLYVLTVEILHVVMLLGKISKGNMISLLKSSGVAQTRSGNLNFFGRPFFERFPIKRLQLVATNQAEPPDMP